MITSLAVEWTRKTTVVDELRLMLPNPDEHASRILLTLSEKTRHCVYGAIVAEQWRANARGFRKIASTYAVEPLFCAAVFWLVSTGKIAGSNQYSLGVFTLNDFHGPQKMQVPESFYQKEFEVVDWVEDHQRLLDQFVKVNEDGVGEVIGLPSYTDARSNEIAIGSLICIYGKLQWVKESHHLPTKLVTQTGAAVGMVANLLKKAKALEDVISAGVYPLLHALTHYGHPSMVLSDVIRIWKEQRVDNMFDPLDNIYPLNVCSANFFSAKDVFDRVPGWLQARKSTRLYSDAALRATTVGEGFDKIVSGLDIIKRIVTSGVGDLIPHEALAEIGDLAEYSKRVVKNLWNYGRNAAFYGKVADKRPPKAYTLAMGYLATFAVNAMKDSSLANMSSWRSYKPEHIHPAFAEYCNREDQNEMTKEQAEHLKAIEYQGLVGTNSHKIISIVFEEGSEIEEKKAKEIRAAITKIFKSTMAKAPDSAPTTEVKPRTSTKRPLPEKQPGPSTSSRKKRAASTPTIDEE